MKRSERFKLSMGIAILAFFMQVVLLVVNVQFVDESTGHFRLGAQFRFKFVDDTTREFVLLSQLQRLPEELVRVLEVSAAIAMFGYVGFGFYYRHRPLDLSEETDRTAETMDDNS